MKKNMGSTDRIVRLLIAVILAGLYFGHVITGTTGTILMVVGIIFALTSLVSFCPIYAIFGLRTCPADKS